MAQIDLSPKGIRTAADSGVTDAATAQSAANTLSAEQVKKVTKTIAFGDLTDSDLSQTFQVGALDLPNGAVVLGTNYKLTDGFESPTGDGTESCVITSVKVGAIDVSVSADWDLYNGGANADGASTAAAMMAPTSGGTCNAVITATADNLDTFTAGSVTVEVYFTKAPELA